MNLSSKLCTVLVVGILTAAPALANAHKPGCRGLPDATKHSNSACED